MKAHTCTSFAWKNRNRNYGGVRIVSGTAREKLQIMRCYREKNDNVT